MLLTSAPEGRSGLIRYSLHVKQGRQAVSGICIYKLTSGGGVKAKKMMLVR